MSYLTRGQTQDRTRPVIARLVFIKCEILKGKPPVNAVTLAKKWECHRKTIDRDLEFLRDRLGHEIEYDAAAHTLRYTKAPEPVL